MSPDNEVTILMPDDDDNESATTTTARSAPGGGRPTMQQYPTKQQLLSHRRPNLRPPHHNHQQQHLRGYDQAGFVKSWKIDYEYGLDDYHTVFRTPHFVTDAEYQRHLRGELPALGQQQQQTWSNNNNNNKQVATVIISGAACANFCFVFSVIATILLTFFGLLLDTQALYIPGTLPAIPVQSTVDVHGHIRNKQVYEYLIPDTERLPIATTAYRTAFLYLICSIVAMYYIHTQNSPYTSIPETLLPAFVSRASAANHHNDSLWHRMVRRVKRQHARYRTKKQEKKG
jgi:hypothetical protein